MQIFFHFFLILCAFFLFTILRFARTCVCAPSVDSHPRQNGLVAMNVARDIRQPHTLTLPFQAKLGGDPY